MGWPYQFLDLSESEKHLRRQTLDWYALLAQLSALLPVAIVLIFKINILAARWAGDRGKGSYDSVPNSPALKSQRRTGLGALSVHVRQLRWWLGDDIVLFGQVWGQRDQWIVGSLWAIWLSLLCVLGTGSDYLHFTKRFGAVAVSQFPLQYLMALKSLNPFALVFGSSHERVNRFHRVLGRIIYTLLCCHAALYLNFFVQAGIFKRRIMAGVVVLGVLAFFGMTMLNTTALRAVRKYSYRVFFVTHLIVAFSVPLLIFFHAKPARWFVGEATVVFIVDLVSRKMDTVTSKATLESIPGTGLVKISAPIPYNKVNRFRQHPGSHVYVSVPPAARQSSNPASASHLMFEFLFNPFTVAHVDEENNGITLVVRQLSGPMTSALARLTGVGKRTTEPSSSEVSSDEVSVPLNIEGPYNIPSHFPQLSSGKYNRVLLVAGGIGATFTVPLYRALLHDNPNAKVEMIWAVRGAGDATWAVMGNGTDSITNDPNVHIFLTGDILDSSSVPSRSGASAGSSASDGTGVELGPIHADRRRSRNMADLNRKRPDLQKIVDGVFQHGSHERVAILVCGPAAMARELREHVGVWVMKGRMVWWHNEGFGW